MKNSLMIIVLGVLAVLSFMLMRSLDKSLQTKDEQQPTREIVTGYDVSVHYYDAKHQLEYVIDSKAVTQYSNNYGTRFNQPMAQDFDNGQLSWEGEAIDGFLSGDKSYLKLSKDVHFIQAPQSMEPLHVESSVVYYDKNTNLISSDQKTVLYDDTIYQRSQHFSLNTQTEIVNFHEDIKAKYHNSPKNTLEENK